MFSLFNFRKWIVLFTSFFVMMVIPATGSDVHIEIERTESPKIPIGILAFQYDLGVEKEAKTLRQVFLADLNRSLAFQISDFVPTLSSSHPLPDFIKKIAGENNQAVLNGLVQKDHDQIKLDLTLYNGKTGKWMWERILSSSIKDLRQISHRASDQVVYQLTGEKGIAETEIAYVSDVTGSKEVYRMDYDGFNPRLVTLNHTINLFPRWSPDGSKISYTSYIGRNPDIWIYDITSSKRWRVTSEGLNLSPIWFPDGKEILFATSHDGQTQFYTSTEEGKKIQRLTFSGGNDLSPSFSPTGQEIVFNSDREGTPQLYLMSSDGTNVRRLTFEGDYNTTPVWSPKGDWITYTCRFDNYFHVCLISPDGQKKKNLTPNLYDDESPVWSPDGKHLAFSSNREGKYHIYMMTVDGTDVEKLTTNNGNNINPGWSPFKY